MAAALQQADPAAPFGWRIAYAPGIGHDSGGMAPFAVPYLVKP
ncbi:MAG TPA: hypothetical protein VFV30_13190 [Novosphingobium sp.]|nr:hypothetical protein [Novosphingobium sp.]